MSLFGTTHLLTLLGIFLAAAVCILAHRRGKRWPLPLLAWLNLLCYAANQAAYATLDFPVALDNILPFHLCDLAALICAAALLTRKDKLCELAYLWGLAGTIQGLITPNMPHPPDHPIFWSFFLQHGVIVATALFLPLALKWRPNRGSFWRVQLWSQLYFFSALGLNFLLGTNFGFLRAKPQQASILDHFGPWPQYLIAIQLFALLAYLLLLLPFAKRLRQRK